MRNDIEPKIKHKALFLDRDGVINLDKGYVFKKKDFIFLDGILELIKYAKSLDYLVVIITNQSGIGRGLYSEDDFHKLSTWMKKEIEIHGGVVNAIYFCPSHPIHGIGSYKMESIDRKPNPGMLIKACMDFDIDLQESIFIGDKLSDMQAGISAKVGKNILFSMDENIKNPNFLKVTSFDEIYKYF